MMWRLNSIAEKTEDLDLKMRQTQGVVQLSDSFRQIKSEIRITLVAHSFVTFACQGDGCV